MNNDCAARRIFPASKFCILIWLYRIKNWNVPGYFSAGNSTDTATRMESVYNLAHVYQLIGLWLVDVWFCISKASIRTEIFKDMLQLFPRRGITTEKIAINHTYNDFPMSDAPLAHFRQFSGLSPPWKSINILKTKYLKQEYAYWLTSEHLW